MSPAIDRSALLARLLSLDSLDTLESFLLETPAATRRRDLWQLFLSRCEYQHAGEWAEAVRICEALTIVGWGSREQVDAVCELWENGWHTYFVNAQSEYRFREAT